MKIFSKEPIYTGSGYATRVGLTGQNVEVVGDYGIKKVPTIGYIKKNNRIQNYFCYSQVLKGFHTFKSERIFQRFISFYKLGVI